MTAEDDERTPPDRLPDSLVERLETLEPSALRAVSEYAAELLEARRPPLEEQIRENDIRTAKSPYTGRFWETFGSDLRMQWLTDHVLVPVADEADARTTAMILKQYRFNQITVVHVIEKAGGAPDKLSLEQAESRATDAFAAFREIIPDAESEIVYATDVVNAVIDIADDVAASTIAFRPRGGSRLVQFLSGDKALRLFTESDRPVIAFQEDIINETH